MYLYEHVRPIVLGIAGGIVGVAVTLVLWHLWTDHWQHHQIWQLELNRAAAAQATPPK